MSFTITNGPQWHDTTGAQIQAHSGGMHIEDGVYYWYGTHMGPGVTGNVVDVGVVCYRSTDLMNWEPLGPILTPINEDGHDIRKGCRMERPKIVKHADGRYLMWFHWVESGCGHESARTGVAEADSITGPFRYLGTLNPDGWDPRDQTLFKDTDGSVYHVYAAGQALRCNRTINISLISDDYRRPSGMWTPAFAERSMEAPAIINKDGRYWMFCSGCSGWNPNRCRVAWADNMLGPWYESGDPCREHADEDTSVMYHSQPNYAFELVAKPGHFVLMADRWNGQDHHQSRPIWLPILFDDQGMASLNWYAEWGPEVWG
ncbi:MAG: family 43 glycosylhydrolase [Planctomycetota bacterium]|jgi:hypothetical protein|nr:family 43 glycosylhydrolase [Planctomycetota bacterium]